VLYGTISYPGFCVPTCSKHTLFEKGDGYPNVINEAHLYAC